jgi:hypothetical protein
VRADAPGSCAHPLELIPSSGASFLGLHTLSADLSQCDDEATLSCFADGSAPDAIVVFTVPAALPRVVMDARVVAAPNNTVDTLLELRREQCRDRATVEITDLATHETRRAVQTPQIIGCNDAATPPGNFGSRMLAELAPGAYYLVLSTYPAYAYNLSAIGDSALQSKDYGSSLRPGFHVALSVNFLEYMPQCDEKMCGSDGAFGVCGTCAEGELCNADFQCAPDPAKCAPRCANRTCGDDGCGGSCGSCAKERGEYCVVNEGGSATCEALPECNSMQPVCFGRAATTDARAAPGCDAGFYCASNCSCVAVGAPLPDLAVSAAMLAYEVVTEVRDFMTASCAVVERCITQPGARKLLRFNAAIVNQGASDMPMPAPRSRPDMYEYSACHRHFHFEDFSEYALIADAEGGAGGGAVHGGRVIATGHKQSFCLEDTFQVLAGPRVNCGRRYGCDNPGIQMGWVKHDYSAPCAYSTHSEICCGCCLRAVSALAVLCAPQADLYGRTLDCQWVDITDLKPGNYTLRVEVNQLHRLVETSYDNNVITLPVILPLV